MLSRNICILFLCWCLSNCAKPVKPKQLVGYWQIEKVTQSGETFYPAAGDSQFDFYQLRPDYSGFRKKLSPAIGASFSTSKDQTDFQLIEANGKWVLVFETPWDQWQETIMELTDDKLVLAHQDRLYIYQRKQANNGAF